MGRLIDADVLKKHYSWWNNEEKEIFDGIVDAQPTAYDVEKVIAELEEKLEQPWVPLLAKNGYYNAIEIVRNGGKE